MNKRCVVCGFPFESDDSTNVCSDDCREVRRQMMREAYNNRVKAQKKLKVKTCIVCGKEFTGRNCGKCCSVECLGVWLCIVEPSRKVRVDDASDGRFDN